MATSNGEPAAIPVEFLEGVSSKPAAPTGGGRWKRRNTAALAMFAVAAALLLGSLIGPTRAAPDTAELYPLEVYFGDPFDVEWIDLVTDGGPTAEPGQPWPMASIEPACVGFSRPDWPADKSHPSVAHCIADDSLDQLTDDASFGLWQIVAGAETWILLYFPTAMEDFSAQIDGGVVVGPGQIHRGGPFVAIAVPTVSSDIELTWRSPIGLAYQCRFDRYSTEAPTCS